MPLSLTTAERAFLRRPVLGIRLLAEFHLSGGVVRASNAEGPITALGQTWPGLGQIVDVSGRGFSGSGASGITITINGAGLATETDPSGATLLATIYGEAQPLDPVILRQFVFDGTTLEAGPVLPYFTGFLSTGSHTITPGGAAVMTLEIESDDLMLKRSALRVRSDDDQRRMWPTGGGGFHQLPRAVSQDGVVWWGQDAPAGATFAGGGAGGGGAGPGGGGGTPPNNFENLLFRR
jgi:hypothetical protein